MRTIISLILLLYSNLSFASPEMMICSSDCSEKQVIQITDESWTEIVTIFKKTIHSDKEERTSVAKAIKCIELDIIQQSINQSKQQGDNELISLSFSAKDEIFNTRKAIILFLDNGFIQKHVLRNSQKRTAWLVNDESAAALQSRKNGDIYIVDPVSTPFGTEPQITHYQEWKNEKTIKHLPKKIADFLNKLIITESRQNEPE